MNGPIVYAFGVGMVATFNPCGFAMLPAYLSYFLGLESTREGDDDTRASVLRALAVGLCMTAGFMVVFALLGLVLEPVMSTVNSKLPWLTVVFGVALVVLGIAMLMGRTFSVRLPRIGRGPDSREYSSMFVFGVSYALVSLSCTLPLFTAAISTTVDTRNWFAGFVAFLAYGLGMGLVLMVLTLAIALARRTFVTRLRGVLPWINRISGALLVLAGAYVTYYGWYELRVFAGNSSGGGPAQWALDLDARLTTWIDEVGATRLGLLLALAIAIVVFVVLLSRSRERDR